MDRTASGAVPIDPEHDAIAGQLHEYAAALALGLADRDRHAPILAHLGRCAACRARLARLTELAEPAYGGALAPAARRPRWRVAPPSADGASWRVDPPGRLAVQLAGGWLRPAVPPPLAATRGAGHRRYELPEGAVPGLRLAIEIAPDEADPTSLRLEVQLDDGARAPLDQGGVPVTVTAGGRSWAGETDATGCATFAGIPAAPPLALRFEVVPVRAPGA